MSKPTKSKAEEAMKFLDDLDFSVDDVPESLPAEAAGAAVSSSTPAAGGASSGSGAAAAGSAPAAPPTEAEKRRSLEQTLEGEKEAEDALKFLNDLTSKPRPSSVPPKSAATTPPPPAAAAAVAPTPPAAAPTTSKAAAAAPSASRWGVPSSLWGSASAALQQAREAAESIQREGTKAVQGAVGDVAKSVGVAGSTAVGASDATMGATTTTGESATAAGGGWGNVAAGWGNVAGLQERLKALDLEKLRAEAVKFSQSGLTNLLATIAPPIAEHEVIEIWLTHDMAGYEGVDGLVYRGLSKILEQVEGGELVVNKGKDEVPKAGNGKERDLNAVEGFEAAFKLAEESLQDLARKHAAAPPHPPPSSTVPITVSSVFLRIQPVFAPLPFSEPASTLNGKAAANAQPRKHLSFIVLLLDPSHSLRMSTISQPVPESWMAIPYEENEWVEEALVDVIRKAVEVVGQEYVARRMGILGAPEGEEELQQQTESTPATATPTEPAK